MFQKQITKAKVKVNEAFTSFSDIVQQTVVVIVTFSALFWLAVFIYGSFYVYYVPVVAQQKSVYFHFRVCETGVGMCSFPIANISLMKEGKNEVFKVGQPYKIVLDLDVPESENNRNIGMFMIEMKLYNKHGETVHTSSRSASIHYKSSLLRIMETFAFAPFYLFGYMNQRQFLNIELFQEFVDNAYNPTVGFVIEVQSMKVEMYSATLRIFAQFSGLRYFLYYWPVTSAVVGISWNFMTICFMALLSWYQFWLPKKEEKNAPSVRINLYGNRRPPSPRKTPTALRSAADSSSKETETVGATGAEETSLLTPGSTSKEERGLRLRQPHSVEPS